MVLHLLGAWQVTGEPQAGRGLLLPVALCGLTGVCSRATYQSALIETACRVLTQVRQCCGVVSGAPARLQSVPLFF